jgi:uncharacterized protein YggE
VHAKLNALGVPPEAVRTLHYDLQPEYDHVRGRQTLCGFVARDAIEVRLDDLSQVGTVVDAAVDAGATSIPGGRFALKQRDELERDALEQAVVDARARVEAAASAASVVIERIWTVEEQRLRPGPPVPVMIPTLTRGAFAASPPSCGIAGAPTTCSPTPSGSCTATWHAS